ncbi:50S ribosomal protein L11 [Candidatus Dojkabacteria bacterium]|nr:50S ribosomal protein L11 [Candidatus Dojkabacteria bacterium]
MAKEIMQVVKLIIPAGQASPAPPIGPALSQYGINIGDFTNQFNEKTQEDGGILTPVVLTIYKDRSFSVELKTPPTSELIRRRLGIKKGSSVPNLKKVGKLTQQHIDEIIEIKKDDFNTTDRDKALKIIEGQAKQMGVEIEK